MPELSSQAQPKTRKKRTRRPRNNAIPEHCVRCGAFIVSRGNRAKFCNDCLPPKYVKHMEAIKARQKLQRAGVLPPPKPRPLATPYQKKRPETFSGQHISKTGKDFLIVVGNGLITVPMVCQMCNRDNNQVQGHWGPIYGQYDDNGNELYQVLLCRLCYDAECEKYGAQTIAS